MAVTPINDTTYEVTLVGGDKVELGDGNSITFNPHIKLNRWGGECFIAIQPAGEIEEVEHEVEGDKIKCKYKVKQGEFEFEWETEFYPLEPRTVTAKDKDGNDVEFRQNELGGFEFEVILKEKPPTNKIVLDIETQGLKFYYQPELTPEEIAGGCIRPENVVGSYAVYHTTKTPFHKSNEEAEKYKVGKAFHIYRPKIIDSTENWVWGELNIDIGKKLLTVEIPQEFLDTAVYPIRHATGATFGFTGEPETTAAIPNDQLGSKFGGAAGTATKLSAYLKTAFGSYWTFALYKDSDKALQDNGGVDNDDTEQSTWKHQTISVGITAVDYLLMAGGSSVDIHYDTGSAGQGQDATPGVGWWEWDDPITIGSTNTNKYSIYCTYEEEAPPPAGAPWNIASRVAMMGA